MPSPRAVLVLGMHRSGTSAMARGLAALGVYLGTDFLDAKPENPTGYWEDKGVVEIDDRVLAALGLRWDSVALVEPRDFETRRVHTLARDAIRHCERTFGSAPLWGFKDPRVIRVLPFWERVLGARGAGVSSLIAIRNPRSVAASLQRRQAMEPEEAYRLWLAHMVPFLRDATEQPHVLVDYDLLISRPQAQLVRVARALRLDAAGSEIERFTAGFLDERLRHAAYSLEDLETNGDAARLAGEAYQLLLALALDRRGSGDAGFVSEWAQVEAGVRRLLPRVAARRSWFS